MNEKRVSHRTTVTRIEEGVWPEEEYVKLPEKGEDGEAKYGNLLITKYRTRTTEVFKLDSVSPPEFGKLMRLLMRPAPVSA